MKAVLIGPSGTKTKKTEKSFGEKSRLIVLRRNSHRDLVSDFIKGSVTMNYAELQNKRVKKTH